MHTAIPLVQADLHQQLPLLLALAFLMVGSMQHPSQVRGTGEGMFSSSWGLCRHSSCAAPQGCFHMPAG